jgi:hypothetical protein
VAEHAATLADESNAILDAAQRHARIQHVQHHAIDVVGDAEAVRSDHGEPRGPRGGGDGILCGLIADLSKARGEHHGGADFSPRAGHYRFVYGCGRKREYGEFDAFWQFVGTLQYRAAIDGLVSPADQIDITLEVVNLKTLQNNLAGTAFPRRYSDDCDRARPQESCDRFRTAGVLRSAHAKSFAVSLSGCHIKRCSPLASGSQYGLTFMPTFNSSAVQLTTSAMTLTPTSSVTLATA